MYIYLYLCVYFFLIVLKEDQIEMKRLFYIPCITLKKIISEEKSLYSLYYILKKSFQDLKSHQHRIGYVRNWLGVTWGE